MKEKRILSNLGQVDEKYIYEAAPGRKVAKRPFWVKWGVVAACLCLVVVAIHNQNNIIPINSSQSGDIKNSDINQQASMQHDEKESGKKVANAIMQSINFDKIEKITVSTQMTVPKKDIVLEKEQWNELLYKLNTFSLTQINEEKKNGWQYLFKIEEGGGVVTLISFMNERVILDDTIYKVENYVPEDFLYLFEIEEKSTYENADGNPASVSKPDETAEASVDEDAYSEARAYSAEILDLQDRISNAMRSNELPFVTSSMILENPDRIHVTVTTTDEEAIEVLKAFDTSGKLLEIEYLSEPIVEELLIHN